MKKNFIMNNASVSRSSGFTIIETLVAITILMIAIVGPLTVAHKGLTAAVYARDQMIASYLAQDAIEYVKNARDSNKLASRSWLYGFDGNSAAANPADCIHGSQCTVDTTINSVDDAVLSCSGTGPECIPQLFLSDEKGYSHDGAGLATQFNRHIIMTPDPNRASEVKLTAVVSWQNGIVDNDVTLTSELFDTFR
ncbi:MAG: seg [Candidatus Taylorbacteria bacterium]|nr:seg [Candidatus Taylorbacteria bacterium]